MPQILSCPLLDAILHRPRRQLPWEIRRLQAIWCQTRGRDSHSSCSLRSGPVGPVTRSSWRTLQGLDNSLWSPCPGALLGEARSEPRVLAGLKILPSVHVQSHLHHGHLGVQQGIKGRGMSRKCSLWFIIHPCDREARAQPIWLAV